MEISSEENVKSYFWKKLNQFRFDLYYFGLHFKSCIFWLRFIRISLAVLTAIVTGAWLGWHEIKWIGIGCPIAILILQAITAGTEWLPFDDRKIELREMIDLLEPLYNDMEQTWEKIVVGDLTIEEIKEATTSFETRIAVIKLGFLKNDALPEIKRVFEKAKSKTDDYFENLSGGHLK